jgi:hypothetical protein
MAYIKTIFSIALAYPVTWELARIDLSLLRVFRVPGSDAYRINWFISPPPLILVLKMKLFPLLYIYYNSLPKIDYIISVVNWHLRRQDLYLPWCQITLQLLSLLLPRLPVLLITYLDIRKVLNLYFMISASVN